MLAWGTVDAMAKSRVMADNEVMAAATAVMPSDGSGKNGGCVRCDLCKWTGLWWNGKLGF